jgi:hypothetical protein
MPEMECAAQIHQERIGNNRDFTSRPAKAFSNCEHRYSKLDFTYAVTAVLHQSLRAFR